MPRETKPRIEDPTTADRATTNEILIAGCGTGEHVYKTAYNYPDARILAIDISAASLAYAFRMTREAGLRNVEYAQADILKMGSIGRSFDRIELVGVLHHLAQPKAGWETLLSLLRPSGTMLVGLYSEAARKAIVDARALIAARGYQPTAQDIGACRQEIIRDNSNSRLNVLSASADFYSMSGCRDLLFNVMEHRFTIPQIKASERAWPFVSRLRSCPRVGRAISAAISKRRRAHRPRLLGGIRGGQSVDVFADVHFLGPRGIADLVAMHRECCAPQVGRDFRNFARSRIVNAGPVGVSQCD